MDETVTRLKGWIKVLDKEILESVRTQATSGQRGKAELERSQKAIKELFEKIREIRAKAEKSEVMVQEICRDIKSLDYAKRHLTAAIIATRNLSTLVTTVEQLRAVTSRRDYREAAAKLSIAREYFLRFEQHKDHPKIRELRDSVTNIKSDLRRRVMQDFSQCLMDPNTPPMQLQPELPEAALVVSALGSEVRSELVELFVTNQLSSYRTAFGRGSPDAGLAQVNRRFIWFKNLVGRLESNWIKTGIFPASWRISQRIHQDFCVATRKDLTDILETTQASNLDISVLLKAITSTIAYEEELLKKFGDVDAEQAAAAAANAAAAAQAAAASSAQAQHDQPLDPEAADQQAIKEKYYRMFQERKKAKEEEERLKRAGQGIPPEIEEPVPVETVRFRGIISGCFEPYMSLYVAHEDKEIGEYITQLAAQEKWISEPGQCPPRGMPYNSVYALSKKIKDSRKTMLSLNRGQAFFELFKVHKRCLETYALIVQSHLPQLPSALPGGGSGAGGGSGGGGGRDDDDDDQGAHRGGGRDWTIHLTEREEESVCLIITTAETLFDSSEVFLTQGKAVVSDAFKDKMDISKEQDVFNSLLNTGIKVLILSLESKLEPALQEMVSLKWASWDTVGDHSPFVTQISNVLTSSVPIYAKYISTNYFKFFTDKFLASFIPKFQAAVFKCRRISDTGAQQMLIDVFAVKSALLEIPNIASEALEDTVTINPASIRYVNKEMGKIETLLKVLQSPVQVLVETYASLVAEQSIGNLQKVLDLKGIKRGAEQQALLDAFTKIAPEGALANRGEISSGGGGLGSMLSSLRSPTGKVGLSNPKPAQAMRKLFNTTKAWTGRIVGQGGGGAGGGGGGGGD